MSEEKKLTENQNQGYAGGEVLDGVVTGITSFGAFVRLPDMSEGLVHISEVADTYVTNIENFISLNEIIKIKVLGKNKKGKYDLSIKQVPGYKSKAAPAPAERGNEGAPFVPSGGGYQKKKEKAFEPGSFDEMMDSFLKQSDEIQLDVRRNMQYKQGFKKKGLIKKKKPI